MSSRDFCCIYGCLQYATISYSSRDGLYISGYKGSGYLYPPRSDYHPVVDPYYRYFDQGYCYSLYYQIGSGKYCRECWRIVQRVLTQS